MSAALADRVLRAAFDHARGAAPLPLALALETQHADPVAWAWERAGDDGAMLRLLHCVDRATYDVAIAASWHRHRGPGAHPPLLDGTCPTCAAAIRAAAPVVTLAQVRAARCCS